MFNKVFFMAAFFVLSACGGVDVSGSDNKSSSSLESSSMTTLSSSSVAILFSSSQDKSTPSSAEEQPSCSEVLGTIPYTDPCLRFQGRMEVTAEDGVFFDWPASTIEAAFYGTSLSVKLGGASDVFYDVWIDGLLIPPIPTSGGDPAEYAFGSIRTSGGVGTYAVASALASGLHQLKIVKRTETAGSPGTFSGLILDEGAGLAELPTRSERRIEFIGDSYVAGYGNESPSKNNPEKQDVSGRTCSGVELAAYTNAGKAYGPLTAQALGAELQVNAYSGLGMTRHYDGNTSYLPFQEYYKRTLVSSAESVYDPSGWIPQVVVLALGTNDLSTPLGANDVGIYDTREDLYTAYREAYHEFLQLLRDRYPGVQIVCIANNLWPDDEMKAQVRLVVDAEEGAGNSDVYYKELNNISGYGCGWHPDIATHASWSNSLANFIAPIVGWE